MRHIRLTIKYIYDKIIVIIVIIVFILLILIYRSLTPNYNIAFQKDNFDTTNMTNNVISILKDTSNLDINNNANFFKLLPFALGVNDSALVKLPVENVVSHLKKLKILDNQMDININSDLNYESIILIIAKTFLSERSSLLEKLFLKINSTYVSFRIMKRERLIPDERIESGNNNSEMFALLISLSSFIRSNYEKEINTNTLDKFVKIMFNYVLPINDYEKYNKDYDKKEIKTILAL